MARVDADRFVCGDIWDLENFLSLVQNCQRMAVDVIEIGNNLGAKGWASLAKVFSLLHGVHYVHAYREDMLGATRESLKTIWDALNIHFNRMTWDHT